MQVAGLKPYVDIKHQNGGKCDPRNPGMTDGVRQAAYSENKTKNSEPQFCGRED